MLRLVTLIYCLVALATCVYSFDDVINDVKECVEESKIDLAKLTNPEKWNMEFIESHENHCFVKCVADKTGFYKKDGTPDIGALTDLVGLKNATKLDSIAQNCSKVPTDEDDDCTKFVKIQECILWDVIETQMDDVIEWVKDMFEEMFGDKFHDIVSEAIRYSEECQNETNIDYSKLLEDPIKFFDSKEVKCFTKCVAVKYGIYNEKGDAVIEKMEEYYMLENNSEIKELVKKCNKDVEEKDVCERVIKIQECIVTPLIVGIFEVAN